MVWRSIGVRLTAWYALILASTFVLSGVGVRIGLRRSIDATVDRELRNRLGRVQDYVTRSGPSRGEASLVRELMEESVGPTGTGALQMADDAGHWIYRSPEVASWSPLPPPRSTLIPRGTIATVVVDRRPWRVLTAPIASGSIQLAMPLHAYYDFLEDFFATALLASPLLLGLAAWAGYWLSRRALRPVAEITETALGITGSTLSERLPVATTDDELRRLSLTLNAMLDRLEAEIRKTRQFTADASHELRTPIAVIQATAEVTLSKERSVDVHEQGWTTVRGQAQRVSTMIDDLLRLARSDDLLAPRDAAWWDLADELRHVCAEMQTMASIGGVTVDTLLPDACPFRGHAESIRRLIAALLDNAIKYTPDGGHIRLELQAERDDVVVIRVTDTGIGIAPDDLSRVFGRFYRVTKDRSRKTGGAGLGLAIAQAIAHEHRGEVALTSTLGVGSVATVTLPR